MTTIDWAIVVAFFVVSLCIGLFAFKRAGRDSSEFFLSGRDMPWWLLGVSMVATTFAIDTPNVVANFVRKDGVSGNWAWWAFLLSGMVTVFVYAKLWRRSEVMTDVEYYELRYSGKEAAFLRGFRAVYLGLIFNVLVMGAVCLAAVKFGAIVLGVEPWVMLLVSGIVVMIYSSLGGLRGVILTDFVQFILAMVGSVWAAVHLMSHEKVGGLSNLLADPKVQAKMEILPNMSEPTQWVPLLLIPLAVTWWSSYFPGAEPGGGGYVAQRMFSAKNEKHSMGAALLFNIAHYALRPWPWIMIALASIMVFPTVESMQAAFPGADPDLIQDDVAYPAMLTLLPPGLLGLVVASLIAAFMSTMSTQVNLGALYLVNDVYRRYMNPEASEKQLVRFGRLSTIVMVILGSLVGLFLTDAGQAFDYLILLGSGTGAIYLLRWLWWRVNAVTEITAMVFSFVVATIFMLGTHEKFETPIQEMFMSFQLSHFEGDPRSLGWIIFIKITPVALTTLTWVITAFITKPTAPETLRAFYEKVRPGGPGWARVRKDLNLTDDDTNWDVPLGLLSALLACFAVYGALFTTGSLIYGRNQEALIIGGVTTMIVIFLVKSWRKIRTQD